MNLGKTIQTLSAPNPRFTAEVKRIAPGGMGTQLIDWTLKEDGKLVNPRRTRSLVPAGADITFENLHNTKL